MEITEIEKLLERREQRVNALRARLAAIKKAEEELEQEFETELSSGRSSTEARPRRRRLRSATATILERSYEILRSAEGHELPMQVREICSRLEAQGVYVGGKNPAGNLSAKLGRDERFQSEGRGGNGWTPAALPNDNDHSEGGSAVDSVGS